MEARAGIESSIPRASLILFGGARILFQFFTICSEKFHVVCLQEVVQESLVYIKEQLSSLYEVFHPQDVRTRDYFPIICVFKHAGLFIPSNTFKVGGLIPSIGYKLSWVIGP